MYNNFAITLKKLRKERNLTQGSLATLLDISINSYSQYELGNTQPHLDNLIKLADFFCVTVDYLIGAPVKPNANPGEILDAEDRKLVNDFHSLNKFQQDVILVQIDALIKLNQKS